jgi:hypothetical protein
LQHVPVCAGKALSKQHKPFAGMPIHPVDMCLQALQQAHQWHLQQQQPQPSRRLATQHPLQQLQQQLQQQRWIMMLSTRQMCGPGVLYMWWPAWQRLQLLLVDGG